MLYGKARAGLWYGGMNTPQARRHPQAVLKHVAIGPPVPRKVVLAAIETIAPQLGPHYPERLFSDLLDQLILLLPGQPGNPWAMLPADAQEALRAGNTHQVQPQRVAPGRPI